MAEMFQAALAELADPMYLQKFTSHIRCPSCQSTKLAYQQKKEN
jgi:LSD1 subclass zinc finger protein